MSHAVHLLLWTTAAYANGSGAVPASDRPGVLKECDTKSGPVPLRAQLPQVAPPWRLEEPFFCGWRVGPVLEARSDRPAWRQCSGGSVHGTTS